MEMRKRLDRIVRSRRRPAATEQGFAMLEVAIAILILAVGLFAVAQTTVASVSSTLKTRQREAATATVNQRLESLRSNGYANLKLKKGTVPPPPTTFKDDDGVTYTTLIDTAGTCTTCVQYHSIITTNNFTFTAYTIVIGVDDASDGLGLLDKDHQTVDFKKVIVQVFSSTVPNSTFTYKTETIIHDTTQDPVDPVQGLEVQILDQSGAQVIDDNLVWTISIPLLGILDEEIDEGKWDNFSIAPGTYTCTVTRTESTRDWYPVGTDPATDSTSNLACTVTAGNITTWATSWTAASDCPATPLKFGDLDVQVQSAQTGNGIVGATVDPVPTAGQLPDPPPGVTGGLGGVTFTAIPVGAYTLTATATGYTPKSGVAACVTTTAGATVVISMQPNTFIPANVQVRVKWTGSGTTTWKVYLNATTVISQDIGHNLTGVFNFGPPAGTYDVKVYCVAKTENLREQVLAQTFVAGVTYYYPGPDASKVYSESKC
jgi:Tfp pilus assembly protein PilV